MPAVNTEQYSTSVGLIYVFNLIVGTGALTLPAVFQKAGWALGLAVVLVLAFMSYVTVTFVVESMAAANAVHKWQITNKNIQDRHNGVEEENEASPLVDHEGDAESHSIAPNNYFCIEEKIELGQMAAMFFNKWGQILFYLCIVVYLYGDLAIYAAAIAKSLTDVACTLTVVNGTVNVSVPNSAPCWQSQEYTRMFVYRIFLGCFVLLAGPFAFFNVQKTKYLQMLTSVMRWLAFSLMIGIAVRMLLRDGAHGNPPTASFTGVPALFGACVYSFMCHHSLPSLLTPIANKTRLFSALAADYILVSGFYLLLAFTGIFAFAQLEDLYTLVFWRPGQVIGYFLALFPVFTLSTNFPVVAVTLRSNLEALFPACGSRLARRVIFPLIAIIPPTAIAMFTSDLSILVGVTGTYAGAGVQYVIPALLVAQARKTTFIHIGVPSSKSQFASPFRQNFWIVFILLWAMACVILVTVNLIEKLSGKI